jgi:hypothetical protein
MPLIPSEFEQLKNDFIWANHRLNEYKNLFFSNNPTRLKLLSETAHLFFLNLKYILRDQLIISAARLTDPYEAGKGGCNKNLSINFLLQLAEKEKWKFKDDLIKHIDLANEKSKLIRKWRNKVVAHKDLPTSKNEALYLKKLNIKLFDELFSEIGSILNLIELNLLDSETHFDIVGRDSYHLIHFLKKAMIYNDLVIEEKDWIKEKELPEKSKFFEA